MTRIDLYLGFGVTHGQINANNAKGNGNRARRRAGWTVLPTAGPEYARQIAQLIASM